MRLNSSKLALLSIHTPNQTSMTTQWRPMQASFQKLPHVGGGARLANQRQGTKLNDSSVIPGIPWQVSAPLNLRPSSKALLLVAAPQTRSFPNQRSYTVNCALPLSNSRVSIRFYPHRMWTTPYKYLKHSLLAKYKHQELSSGRA